MQADLLTRIPPQALEAEQATLGSMLIHSSAVAVASGILAPRDFYWDRHRHIYNAIRALSARGEPADVLTVEAEITAQNLLDCIGGRAYLLQLLQVVPTAAHCEHYARIVADRSARRDVIGVGMDLCTDAFDEQQPTREMLDRAEQRLFAIASDRASSTLTHIKPLLEEERERLDAAMNAGDLLTGVPSGIKALDDRTGGFQKQDLIILAARPSMGKSSAAFGFGLHTAQTLGKQVALFSLEMSKAQVIRRLICAEARVDSTRLRTGNLRPFGWGGKSDYTNVMLTMDALSNLPIYIDDHSDMTPLSIRREVRRMASDGNLGLVVVDFLQLVRPDVPGQSRHHELTTIAHSLKGLGKEVDVPVVALSQLSRAVERREDKHPMLSDLRECVVGDTRLIDAKTGTLVPIRAVRPGDRVLGLGDRQKIGAFEVRDVWSTGVKPVFTLTTQTGRRVTATANHPFLTATGWKHLGELKAGDLIATALRLPEHGEERAERAELCRLLGYLVGDGTFQKHRAVGLCGSDPVIMDDARSIVAKWFPGVTWRPKKAYGTYEEGDFRALYDNGYGKPHGNPLREWLRGLGINGQRDSTKRVPTWVFEAGEIGAREFLSGYLASDGCVKHIKGRGWFVQFDTVSRELAEDVQMLLLRLGVVATISKGWKSAKATRLLYRTQISSLAENMRRFADGIPMIGRKGDLLHRMQSDLPQTVTGGGIFNLPPEISDMLFESSKHLRQFSRKPDRVRLPEKRRLYWLPQGKRPRRDSCARFAEILKDDTLSVWAHSDLLWEPIRQIEADGEQEVYDIAIPGCGNFLANGIVAHNSGSIEECSDLVIMLYRPAYYERKQFAADEAGGADELEEVEFHIEKHRNGPTGQVSAGFLRRYTRFENLARPCGSGGGER